MVKPEPSGRLLETLQRLLEIPSADLHMALTHACDAVSSAMNADKTDAFMFDPSKESLIAIGNSNQPLSALQRRSGLDVMALANGGRVVQAFETRTMYCTGRLLEDPLELKGVREVLKVDSMVCVPLDVGGRTRGVLAISSQARDFFTEDDARFVESVARWVGTVAHRAELVEEIARNSVEQGRRAVAEELVTMLAHDLRNLISPVDTRLQMIRRRAAADQRGSDVRDSDAAMRAVQRLNQMITNILDVARLDQGALRLDPEPIDLAALASEIAGTLSTPEHEVRVTAPEEVIVHADPARVAQCLENLLANAIRHSPRSAPVIVVVSQRREEKGNMGFVEVADEGPGVPVEILPRIFERFVAGTDSLGLGLGLYLARQVAVAHGGELSVESPPGKGARFRLELPMQSEV